MIECGPEATSQGQSVNVHSIEQRLWETLATESPAFCEAVDSLLGALLASTAEFSHRSTDGFIPLREEVSASGYRAVGKVYMIKDQSAQPVAIELSFAPDAESVASGTVRLGVKGKALDHKLENGLLAFPRETAARLDWAYLFRRCAAGWERMDGATSGFGVRSPDWY